MKFKKRGLFAATALTLLIGGGSLLGGALLSESFEKLNQTLTQNHAVNPLDKTGGKETIAPELYTGQSAKPVITSNDFMIVTAHPAASYAGAEILKKGGRAIDALLAAQLVLNLVEPQSSGIGGGGFLLHWDKNTKKIQAFDGREAAPIGVDPKFFFYPNGDAKTFMEAVVGGASVGVPGLLRMFELARQEQQNSGYEILPLSEIMAPAIKLAEDGFPVSPRLHRLLSNDKYFTSGMTAHTYFYGANNQPAAIGEILRNQDYADTLRHLVEHGLAAFYQGEIAKEIVRAVQQAPGNPGSMNLSDMARYQAKIRKTTCLEYRDLYDICGMPPPSSGGIAVAQIMGILDATNINQQKPASADSIQLFAEAMKLAFADRNHYIGDTDFVDVPVEELINKAYLHTRALEMDLSRHPKVKAEAGQPVLDHAYNRAADNAIELPSTTHLVVVDKYGNAASMTTSIETAFGSHQMVGGFLLNNQLTDFAITGFKNGQPIANRIEPGKRPRSSMAPTIVLDKEGNLKILTGSPGGSRIIGYTAQSLVAMLDWQQTAQEAANMPRFLHRNTKLELEEDGFVPELVEDMQDRGYMVSTRKMVSGVHIIEQLKNGAYRSGTDPRREGYAFGDDNIPDSLYDSFSLILPE
ncbi:gamma-glutamyltransferase [Curvivirga aplysinae]|uniref:gamma-glutamyltransferase n=1 Tax=Curvivirga aplysinae TaxID=2529852 RepID=UPI0012BCB83C|nr:gamma-glutamyltransferase [Curvivirga aplysinae]MTI11194.1 gamma-glutamyltransferase [Curvivirga aplysinae]